MLLLQPSIMEMVFWIELHFENSGSPKLDTMLSRYQVNLHVRLTLPHCCLLIPVAIPAPFSASPVFVTYPAPPKIAENAAHWKKEGTPGFLAKAAGMAASANTHVKWQ